MNDTSVRAGASDASAVPSHAPKVLLPNFSVTLAIDSLPRSRREAVRCVPVRRPGVRFSRTGRCTPAAQASKPYHRRKMHRNDAQGYDLTRLRGEIAPPEGVRDSGAWGRARLASTRDATGRG